MTLNPTGWNEQDLAETPAVELLQFLGYTCVLPEGGAVLPAWRFATRDSSRYLLANRNDR